MPNLNGALHQLEAVLALAHVKSQCAATAHIRRNDHLGPQPGQQPHGRVVDLRPQHLLDAPSEQGHAQPTLALGGHDAGPGYGSWSRQSLGCHGQQGPHDAGHQEGEGAAYARHSERQARTTGVGQHPRQQGAEQAVCQGPLDELIQPWPGRFQEERIIHAARAGGLAREAAEAVVDVLDRLLAWGDVLFEHTFDEVNAAAWAFEFVAGE